MAVIFSKTPKGYAEIETRAGGLAPRVRRVLIFVDGKRTVEDLRGMLQSDDLQHTLGLLEEDGYIEMVGGVGPGGRPLTVEEVQRATAAFRLHPPGEDPVRLQKARNFMLNTLNAFVGALGTSSLQDRIVAELELLDGNRFRRDAWQREGVRVCLVIALHQFNVFHFSSNQSSIVSGLTQWLTPPPDPIRIPPTV